MENHGFICDNIFNDIVNCNIFVWRRLIMTNSDSKSKQIAKRLLGIKAVFLRPNDPFTWASGIKSPIYCDNRLTLTDRR